MCGIAALATLGSHAIDLSAIAAMTAAVRHRGPDDEGYLFVDANGDIAAYGGDDTPAAAYCNAPSYLHGPLRDGAQPARCAFGHRRLSIVDLTIAGHQPFVTADSSLILCYNGEIYNQIELRRTLTTLGHTFTTQSDTEVVAIAWQQWGERCLDHFNGMFAFVLYDRRNGSLHAVRDRFGIKPLYYWIAPSGYVAFASEIKQFTTLPDWRATFAPQPCYDFLNWGLFNHNHATLFDGVFQLRGGERLTLKPGASSATSLTPITWYHLRHAAVPSSFDDTAAEYRHLLSDAVRLRLRADVAVGSCLSGGLDSSSIVCLASEQLGHSPDVFSACSHHPRFCERRHIDSVVAASGATPHYHYPDPHVLFDTLPSLIWHQDLPFGSTSIFAQWGLFSAARNAGISVMLDGQGADELLCGYHGFFSHRHYELLRSLRWRKMWRELSATHTAYPHLSIYTPLISKLLPAAIQQPLRRLVGKSATRPRWLDIARLGADDRSPLPQRRPLRCQSRQQLFTSSLPMLLHYEDRNSMAHSIESRTPFLDYRLVEFTLATPAHFKIEDATTKRLLRQAMRDLLPPSIAERRDKVAFATAEEEWVKSEHSALFRAGVERSIEQSHGIITPHALSTLDAIIAGRLPFSFLPWRVISFGAWMERFSIK